MANLIGAPPPEPDRRHEMAGFARRERFHGCHVRQPLARQPIVEVECIERNPYLVQFDQNLVVPEPEFPGPINEAQQGSPARLAPDGFDLVPEGVQSNSRF